MILTALFFKSLKELSLFDLMMSVSSMIQVPLLIPLLLGFFIKKTPNWAPWATVALGLCVSLFVKEVFTAQVFAELIGIEPFTKREAGDMNLILTLAGQVFITMGFFCLTTLFYKEERDTNKEQRQDFFSDLERPVVADNMQDDYDRQQRNKLGAMVTTMSAGVMLMALIPNPLWGRLVFVACSIVLICIASLLKRSTRISSSIE